MKLNVQQILVNARAATNIVVRYALSNNNVKESIADLLEILRLVVCLSALATCRGPIKAALRQCPFGVSAF